MTTPLLHTVQVHKALGHPARLRILAMLRRSELCACQIIAVLGLAPSTVSAHLADLRRAGLLIARKSGRWAHYRLAPSQSTRAMTDDWWRRVRRDPQIRSDAALLGQLKSVPVEELCQADLNLARLAISRHT